MSRSLLRASLALVLIALFPAGARAWDEGGHEIVATIADSRLNPKARAAVEALAAQVPDNGRPYNAVTMACWMDDLRTRSAGMPDAGQFLSWHFVDIGLESGDPLPSFMPGDDNPTHGNAIQALKRAMVVLEGGTDPYVTSSAMACAMVMHLVGDIHQPLHAATKYFYSRGQEQDDHGGNREGVDNGPWDETHFNLHSFWDSAWRASMGSDGRVVRRCAARHRSPRHRLRGLGVGKQRHRALVRLSRSHTDGESQVLPAEQRLCHGGQPNRAAAAGPRRISPGRASQCHAGCGAAGGRPALMAGGAG
jgi:hypothetical protein